MSAIQHTGVSAAIRAVSLGLAFLLCSAVIVPTTLAKVTAGPSNQASGSLHTSLATLVTVTTSAETVDGTTTSMADLNAAPGPDGAISLREALLAASATPTGEKLTIAFSIPISDTGHNDGAWTIRLGESALPPLARGDVVLDGMTQPGDSPPPRIIIDGFSVYEDTGLSNGLTITSPGNSVRGLELHSFYDDGIVIRGPNAANNQVTGCIVRDNGGAGIVLRDGAHDNLIGGSTTEARNIISGNHYSAGVLIRGPATAYNTIAGNWIGVDTSGSIAMPNAFAGVRIRDGAHDNLIGGTAPGVGNVISGNDSGISIEASVANTVAGNIIGLSPGGQIPLGNTNGGIFLTGGARSNLIGGKTSAARNIISGNGGSGIHINGTPDASSDGNHIQGNYIGVDLTGILPTYGNYRYGIVIDGYARDNQIGDDQTGNVIAYNGYGGIRIDADGNRVAGNLIGVGADRLTRLGNQNNGIRIGGADNVIGPSNVIANNQISGIMLNGSRTVVVSNTLEYNARSGICVVSPGATISANIVRGNGGSSEDDCNAQGGIVIAGTNDTLVIENTIHQNKGAGITVRSGKGNRLLTNSITDNSAGGILLEQGGNDEITPPVIENISALYVAGKGCPGCEIEIFNDFGDQGRYFVDSTAVQADGSFRLPLSPDELRAPFMTATLTDAAGNTSPFTPPVSVPAPTSISRLFLPLIVGY